MALPKTPIKKYVHQRYPLNLHKGAYPHILSMQVKNAEQEADFLAAGWSAEMPEAPEPEPERPELTIEQRLTALETLIGARPRKR
jgi:hypothetical protein